MHFLGSCLGKFGVCSALKTLLFPFSGFFGEDYEVTKKNVCQAYFLPISIATQERKYRAKTKKAKRFAKQLLSNVINALACVHCYFLRVRLSG